MLEGILCTDYQATTASDVDANGVTITGSSGTRVDAPVSSCDLGLSLVGYEGLADATVTLGELVDGLDLAAGAPDQALNTDVTVADLFTVMAQSLDDQAGPTAVALNELATEINQSLVVNLGDLLAVESGTVGQAAAAEFNMLELVRGSAQAVNGTNALAVPDLGVSLDGLADVSSDLKVIEAPTQAAGPPGITTADTSQVDLGVEPELTLDLASEVTGLLGGLLSLATLGSLDVTAEPVVIPVGVEVATALASLDTIDCGDPTDETQAGTSTDVTTSTDVVDLNVGRDGDWVDVSSVHVVTKSLVGAVTSDVVLTVQAQASVPLGGATDTSNTFFGPFESGPAHTSGGAVDFSGLTASGLNLRVQTSGDLGILGAVLGSLTSGITSSVSAAALPVIGSLDDAVVQPVLNAMGVGMGNADTWTQSVECQGRRLLPLDS